VEKKEIVDNNQIKQPYVFYPKIKSMIEKIYRIFNKKKGTSQIGGFVWRYLLLFMWLMLVSNSGILINKAITHYNLEDSLMWFFRLFIWV